MPLPASASVITDDLSQYPHIPNFYIVSRSITPAQEQSIHDILRITPVHFSIIIDPLDVPLASRFSDTLLTVADDNAARLMAIQIFTEAAGYPNRSIIISSNPELLIAVYQDREAPIHVGSQ
jgi:hypothetical protein